MISIYNPVHALLIFVFGLIIILVGLDKEGAFTNFTNFGPDKDAKFLHMNVDTWEKVWVVYLISFSISMLQTYYITIIVRDYLFSKLINPAYTKQMDISKLGTYGIILAHPIIMWLLTIINFFVTMTMKLQFLIPQLLGSIVVMYPYFFRKIAERKYLDVKR